MIREGRPGLGPALRLSDVLAGLRLDEEAQAPAPQQVAVGEEGSSAPAPVPAPRSSTCSSQAESLLDPVAAVPVDLRQAVARALELRACRSEPGATADRQPD